MHEKPIINGKVRNEITWLRGVSAGMEFRYLFILLSVAVLQTISWYYTSHRFYRFYIAGWFAGNPESELYSYLYWYLGDTVTLLFIPLLLAKVVLKLSPAELGLQAGEWKAGLVYSGIFLGVMAVIIWFASASLDFAVTYPQVENARQSWRVFAIYSSASFIYLIAWEFIWRGYMLFGLYPKFGIYAVLIQMIPFVILHNGKPPAETFGAIAGGVCLGLLALRTRSVYYCIIVHCGVMFMIDFLSVLRYRALEYGAGADAFLRLLHFILKGA